MASIGLIKDTFGPARGPCDLIVGICGALEAPK